MIRLLPWLATLMALAPSPASAAPKKPAGPPAPGSKAALTLALQNAHTIFLRYGADESSAQQYMADYTAFYADMQQWGRYQLQPDTKGADLVLLYTAFCRDECSVSLYDGRTMAWVGYINQHLGGSSVHVSNSMRVKGAAKFIKKLARYAGRPRAQTAPAVNQAVAVPVLPLPAWSSGLGLDAAPSTVKSAFIGVPHAASPAFLNAFSQWAKTVQRVLLVDERLSVSTNSPFGRKDTFGLIEGDLKASGRLQQVSTMEDADLVLDLSAEQYCDKTSCSDSLDVSFKDPRTLRVLSSQFWAPDLYFKKNQPDTFPASEHSFVQAIRSSLGAPAP